jgi:hypothetical protein
MGEDFVCGRCGKSFPSRQMKEAFIWHGKKRERNELCPSCLDHVMTEGRSSGIVGQKKKAAIQLTPWAQRDVSTDAG